MAPVAGLLAVAVLDLAKWAGGPSEIVNTISDAKGNISKLSRDRTLSHPRSLWVGRISPLSRLFSELV